MERNLRRSDFEKLINELKQWFKGDKGAEAELSNIESACRGQWNEFSGWWWFGGPGFPDYMFRHQILPKLDSLFEY